MGYARYFFEGLFFKGYSQPVFRISVPVSFLKCNSVASVIILHGIGQVLNRSWFLNSLSSWIPGVLGIVLFLLLVKRQKKVYGFRDIKKSKTDLHPARIVS